MTPLQFPFHSISLDAFLLRGLVEKQELVKVEFTLVMAEQQAAKLPEVAINSVLRGWNLNIVFGEISNFLGKIEYETVVNSFNGTY